ncbi:MAG: hypothetical protein NVSMB16_01380 [Acidimicrobiales bacterium]
MPVPLPPDPGGPPPAEPVDRWRPQRSAGPDHADELPEELDAAGFVGPYLFPDNKRRRISGVIYLVIGLIMLAGWTLDHHGGVLVNNGFLVGGLGFVLLALYHRVAGYPLDVRDLEALTAASTTVGFAVGHASAQLGWRGLRSRPTWRILLYSADEPPSKRGLVLVDGVDGSVVAHFVEDNPEDWSQFDV